MFNVLSDFCIFCWLLVLYGEFVKSDEMNSVVIGMVYLILFIVSFFNLDCKSFDLLCFWNLLVLVMIRMMVMFIVLLVFGCEGRVVLIGGKIVEVSFFVF